VILEVNLTTHGVETDNASDDARGALMKVIYGVGLDDEAQQAETAPYYFFAYHPVLGRKAP